VAFDAVGIEGYKAIAYELAAHRDTRGDLLSAIRLGYQELVSAGAIARTPRLFAVQSLPWIGLALA
jgi:hypothetical protein